MGVGLFFGLWVNMILSTGTWRNLKAILGLNGLQGVLRLQEVVISPLQGTDVSLPFFYPVSVEFRNKSSHFLETFNATRAAGDG